MFTNESIYLHHVLGVRNVITTIHIHCLTNFTIVSLNTNAIHMRTRIHAHDARTRTYALYLDTHAKPNTFLRAHARVLQGIYIRGRTYAHARAQISNNIYCIHYYDSRPISTRQHREPAAAYTCTFCYGLMSMQKLSYTSNVSAFFCMNKKISGGDSSSDILSDFQ